MSETRPMEGQYAFVYLHKKTKEVRVVNPLDAAIFDLSFDRKNWHHTSSLNCHIWMEYMLNQPRNKRLKIVDSLVKMI